LFKFSNAVGYFVVVISTLLILIGFLHFDFTLMNLPMAYRGDELEWISYIQDRLTRQPYLQLYAPFEIEVTTSFWSSLGHAITTPFWLMIISLTSIFVDDPVFATNLYWMFTYPLTSLSMALLLRHVGCSWTCSLAFSIIYAFLPFHQARATNHLLESSYYVVPIYTLFLLNAATKTPIFSKPFGTYTVVAALFLTVIAPTSQYYTFIFLVLLTFVSAFGAYQNRSLKNLLSALLIIFMASTSLLKGEFIPETDAQLHIEKTARTGQSISTYGDVERFGLKIIQVILPIAGHKWETANRLRAHYDQHNPLINENSTANIGLILSLGFLGLLTISVGRVSTSRETSTLAALTVATVLFATIGGFSSLMSLIGSALAPHSPLSEARAFNRTSVFLACFACLFLGKLISDLPLHRLKKFGLCSLILTIALYDMIPRGLSISDQQRAAMERFSSDKNFFTSLEALLIEKGALVFQLPHATHHRTTNYQDFLIPKLHTKNIAWSFGGDEGSQQNQLSECLAGLSGSAQALAIKSLGFSGILIDKFKDTATLPINMGSQLELESDRYAYLSLDEYDNQEVSQSSVCKPLNQDGPWQREFSRAHPSINLIDSRETIRPKISESGIIQYGPYIALPAAQYRVTWLGGSCLESSGVAEVTANNGNTILSAKEFNCEPAGTLATIDFTLDRFTQYIEFRTHSTGSGDFKVDTIVLENIVSRK
jgi:hypothetical protein